MKIPPAMQETTYNPGDLGLIPGSGRFPGEENGSPLQYSCLENPMDTGAWRATVNGVARESDTIEQLNNDKKGPEGVVGEGLKV